MKNQENDALPTETPPVPREPILNIPAVLLTFIVVMIAVFLAQTLFLGPAAEDRFYALFSFEAARYVHPFTGQDAGWLLGPVTYSFLHGSITHLVFNTLWMAVFATPVARRIGAVRFTLLWITSAVASAFFFAFATGFAPSYLIGASGVVSATSGAVCRFAISRSGFAPGRLVHTAPRLSIFGALRRRSVLAFVAFWLFSNVLLGLGMTMGDGGAPVAWQAHIGGFLFGYLAFALFDPARARD